MDNNPFYNTLITSAMKGCLFLVLLEPPKTCDMFGSTPIKENKTALVLHSLGGIRYNLCSERPYFEFRAQVSG